MTREEILSKLREVMRSAGLPNEVDWDQVNEESTIESLGFDSLSILDLVYDIQQAFEVDFPAESLVTVGTVGELATFLEQQLS